MGAGSPLYVIIPASIVWLRSMSRRVAASREVVSSPEDGVDGATPSRRSGIRSVVGWFNFVLRIPANRERCCRAPRPAFLASSGRVGPPGPARARVGAPDPGEPGPRARGIGSPLTGPLGSRPFRPEQLSGTDSRLQRVVRIGKSAAICPSRRKTSVYPRGQRRHARMEISGVLSTFYDLVRPLPLEADAGVSQYDGRYS